MRHIIAFIAFLVPSILLAQTQGEPISTGSNLHGLACRVNENQTDLADTEADANFCAADKKGNILVGLRAGTSSVSNPVKLEDVGTNTGDAAFGFLTIKQAGAISSSYTADADGDYQFVKSNNGGQLYISGSQFEDVATVGSDALVAIGAKIQAALSVDAADGDFGLPKLGLDGRLMTSLAPAGETWQSCGTATAVTSDVAIKAAVASNRIYVTSIACKNTSTTVGPTLDFKDGTTIISVGGITATSGTGLLTSETSYVFPTPLRGTVNTAFNFATNTATTSVTCCAQGYISVN